MNRRQAEVMRSQLDDEERIIRDLKRVYGKAREDIEARIARLDERADMEPENIQTIVYQKKYQEALRQQIDDILEDVQESEYKKVSDYLAGCYRAGYLGAMYDIHGQGIPVITPINQDEVIKAVQTDSKLSTTLYKRLGEDITELKGRIRGNLSRYIAQGKSWTDAAVALAKGMHTPYDKAINYAIRIARTEGHRIQNASAYDAMTAAKNKGADVVKQWDATLDGSTRKTHRKLDGQIRELDEPFEVSGHKAKAPGHFGRPEEDINCRCSITQRARWALDEDELKTLEDRAKFYGLDKTKDFEDFKQKYMQAVDLDTLKERRKALEKKIKDAESTLRREDYREKTIERYANTRGMSVDEYINTAKMTDDEVRALEKRWGEVRDKINNLVPTLDKWYERPEGMTRDEWREWKRGIDFDALNDEWRRLDGEASRIRRILQYRQSVKDEYERFSKLPTESELRKIVSDGRIELAELERQIKELERKERGPVSTERVFSGTTFTDQMAKVFGEKAARETMEIVYERLDACPVPAVSTVWRRYFHDFKVEKTGSGAYYSPGTGRVSFAKGYIDGTGNDRAKSRTTIFHEVGHGIDDYLAGNEFNGKSLTDDMKLGKIIFDDWQKALDANSPEKALERLNELWKKPQGATLTDWLETNGYIDDYSAARVFRVSEKLGDWVSSLPENELKSLRKAGIVTDQGGVSPDWILTATKAQREKVMPEEYRHLWDTFMIPKKASITASVKKGAKNNAVREIMNDLRQHDRGVTSALSDWLECLTGQPYPLGFGHGKSYWTRRANKYLGISTQEAKEKELASEAFAELFEMCIGNQEGYDLAKKYFPSAVEWFESTMKEYE